MTADHAENEMRCVALRRVTSRAAYPLGGRGFAPRPAFAASWTVSPRPLSPPLS